MQASTAKHIGEIAGLGLAANYAENVVQGHPQHPEMEGGLTPRLSPTGDAKHDLAMGSGRLALNMGIAWWILLPVWKGYALVTGLALLWTGPKLHVHVIWIGIVVWCLLQLLYFWACGRIFDGKRVKKSRQKTPIPTSTSMTMTFINNWDEPIPVAWHRNQQRFIDAWGRPFSVYNHAL